MRTGDRQASVLKGLLAGTIAGLIGAWVMNQFQSLLKEVSQSSSDGEEQTEEQGRQAQQEQQGQEAQQQDPATVQTAAAVSERVFHHELTQEEKKLAGPGVHYGFGAAVGAFYGAAAEAVPAITAGQGAVYGTLVWVGADEIGVPLAGFSSPPTEYPPSVHASTLGAHLVYGVSTELTRSAIRSILR